MSAWVQEIRAKAKNEERLLTAYGRPISTLAPDEAYKAVNYLIQGTAADLLIQMTLDVADELDERFPTARLWLPIHDELVIECDEENAERVREMLEARMAVDLDGVPIWGEAKVLGPVWTK
ncbi:DNA polymerase I [compost metagenome]